MATGNTGYCEPVHGPHAKKGTVSGIHYRLNYSDIFIVYEQFTNVAADSRLMDYVLVNIN
jgi:hypothetical protein